MATHKSEMALARSHDAKNFVMLAHKYTEKKNILGWLVQEKIDGVRARWMGDGFYSRTGREYPCPDSVIRYYQAYLGEMPLDGELSCGRGKFQQTVSIVRNSHSDSADWIHVQYNIFDYISDEIYMERAQHLENVQDTVGIHILPILGRVYSEEDILDCDNRIHKLGGEGLIFRNPNGFYTFGRSHDLLKKKTFDSAEAIVLGETLGEGKHSHGFGALTCLWNNQMFKIGTGFSDEQRDEDFLGKKITFSYFGLTNDGIPRHPTFVEVRDYE